MVAHNQLDDPSRQQAKRSCHSDGTSYINWPDTTLFTSTLKVPIVTLTGSR